MTDTDMLLRICTGGCCNNDIRIYRSFPKKSLGKRRYRKLLRAIRRRKHFPGGNMGRKKKILAVTLLVLLFLSFVPTAIGAAALADMYLSEGGEIFSRLFGEEEEEKEVKWEYRTPDLIGAEMTENIRTEGMYNAGFKGDSFELYYTQTEKSNTGAELSGNAITAVIGGHRAKAYTSGDTVTLIWSDDSFSYRIYGKGSFFDAAALARSIYTNNQAKGKSK